MFCPEMMCISLDLERGAVVSTFTGHDGYVQGFSTSEADSSLFATACSDGCARLYDVRMPHPTLTFNVEGRLHTVEDVVYTHIDGLPVMFTGGEDSQGIKLWDIRNKQCVYELSTGNTVVSTLIWNSKCATLYASTGCPYVDRRGFWHGYRTVRDPALPKDRWSPEWRGGKYRGRVFDEDDRYWPTGARHDERSFGYIYDAGDHSLFEYAFKENARVDVLPRYGDAQPARSKYGLQALFGQSLSLFRILRSP